MSWDRVPTEAVISIDDYRTRCCLPVHLPRLHHHWQPLIGRRDQLQLLPVSWLECGQVPSCLWRQRWRSTMPVLGAIQVLRNAFSGNWTPTHPLVTLITLNLTPVVTLFPRKFDTPLTLRFVTLEWPLISTLLYCSETWTTYAGQERRLNTFHLRSIHILAGQSNQHWCTVSCWSSQYVHSA